MDNWDPMEMGPNGILGPKILGQIPSWDPESLGPLMEVGPKILGQIPIWDPTLGPLMEVGPKILGQIPSWDPTLGPLMEMGLGQIPSWDPMHFEVGPKILGQPGIQTWVPGWNSGLVQDSGSNTYKALAYVGVPGLGTNQVHYIICNVVVA